MRPTEQQIKPEQVRFRDLSPAHPEHDGRALLFIKGYLQERCDDAAWTDAFRRLGWRGSIVALDWYTGGRVMPHVVGGLVGSLVVSHGVGWLAGNWLPMLASRLTAAPPAVWAGAAKLATWGISAGAGSQAHWKYYCRRADAEGARLGALLSRGRPLWARRDLRIAAYSLGARVVHAALRSAAASAGCIVEGVDLYAGAVATDVDWADPSRAVAGPIRNFYSTHDEILRQLFRPSELATPIGLTPIGSGGSVVDIDASEVIRGHGDYPKRIDRALFGTP